MAAPTELEGDVTVRTFLERNARQLGSAPFASFEDGTTWTHAQALDVGYSAANELRRAGVGAGDRVGLGMPNGPGFVRGWLGAAVLGAITVPINTTYRGAILSHLVRLATPAVVVCSGDFAARFDEADRAGLQIMDESEISGGDLSAPALERPIRSSDAHAYCLTSGTTGPSKLARLSYAHSLSGGDLVFRNWGAGTDDVYLSDMPMYHASGVYFLHAVLSNATGLAVRWRPNLDAYWEVVRDTGATISFALSTIVSYLESRPERPSDRDHRLRTMLCAPAPRDVEAFKARFGITNIHTSWASTELPAATSAWPGQKMVPGYCGQVRPGFEVRLVDEYDEEVPLGEAGEAIVRSDRPWLISTEYVGNPEATAAAWRNGWFHSGDMLRKDADGNFFFVDRSKDAVRRRGQNISSFEVESVVLTYPGIAEAACVPERVDVDVDDEVKVWIVPDPDVTIDLPALLAYCVDRMPHYMVPRYFEIAPEFPMTPTARIQKYTLRERGNSGDTWDRVANGFDVNRFGLQVIDAGDK